ncbi:MAG: phosphoribosylamine--glycine ligase [Thaumarchaeota archaeon]|nr:phosphoribosylamine--glycine ligase [Nitrososphaerota archaeon]
MNVLVIGNGGREDSIRWKLRNEGIHILRNIEDVTSKDLIVIGPETPIENGLTDELELKGIPVFGPSKLAGRLETSKLWAKEFMKRHNIPTAHWLTFTRGEQGMSQVINLLTDEHTRKRYPIVIKEDGLCEGKGVVICSNYKQVLDIIPSIFIDNIFNSSSNKILIEDFVAGDEASCFVITDGDHYKILPFCQDHKRVGDGDIGPNTGGMGAFCPTSRITDKIKRTIEEQIVIPTLQGMKEECLVYKGILYIGLMIDKGGSPYVIEYNARFGDPECQVLMMLMKSKLYPLLEAVTQNKLDEQSDPIFHDGYALTVVMCSGGYPGKYKTGYIIDGLDKKKPDNVEIFHAGTKRSIKLNTDRKLGSWITNGGRVLNVTARGSSLENARKNAYGVAEQISWTGSFYRKDIGEDREIS